MMTPRPLARMRRAAAGLVIVAGLLTLAGCDPRALLYFLQPYEPTVPAACTYSLKGKKVVVLTHAASSASGDSRSVDHDITREFVAILREKIKRIEVVEPSRVRDWLDAHPSWSEPAEVAKAMDADVVIFLEIEAFQISDPSSPGLFKGLSKIHIQLTEMQYPKNSKGKPMTDKPREPEIIYDEACDSEFPKRGPIPQDAGISRSGFKNKFIKLVASEVSWHFVEREVGDDIQDSKIFD
jgi:hypothetical protein